MYYLPSIEKQDMDKCGRERGESEAISHGKEGTHVYRSILSISPPIEVELGVDDLQNVVARAIRGEEAAGIDREGLGVVDVLEVSDWCHDIHYKHESNRNIGSGEPRASQRATEVGRDGRPIDAKGPDPKALHSRTYLLDQ